MLFFWQSDEPVCLNSGNCKKLLHMKLEMNMIPVLIFINYICPVAYIGLLKQLCSN